MYLLHILQRGKSLFPGTDLDNPLYRIHEDLAISDMAGIQGFLRSSNDIIYRNAADDHFQLHLWQQSRINLNAAVTLTGSLLNSAAHDLGDSHSGHTKIIHRFTESVITGELCNDDHLGDS